MTDSFDPDTIDQDTVRVMSALLMLVGADMLDPGTALVMITDDASPFRDVDTLVMRGAVEACKAIADMGDVDPTTLAAFVAALNGATLETDN